MSGVRLTVSAASAPTRVTARLALAACLALVAACGPKTSSPNGEDGDGTAMPPAPPSENGPSSNLTIGSVARVTADFLNLRQAVGTSALVLTEMPCGAGVHVISGPSTGDTPGWWEVSYVAATTYQGWASGKYLIDDASFVPESCGAQVGAPDGGSSPPTAVSDIFDRAKLGVGYSYWWGHGGWRTDGSDVGSCSGNCPSCTHSGSYGADCSGFVAKVWQVPSASALAVDQHPFTTENFYYDQTYWTQIDRAGLMPADALVRRSSSSGHIALVESTSDPYGDVWVYEARGCSSGVTHDMRTFDSTYRAIRRQGL
jgi:hypothetical protein